MFNLDKVFFVLEEMVQNGEIIETNDQNILGPLYVLDEVKN